MGSTRTRAFTLLELVVVVAILAALVGGIALKMTDTQVEAQNQIALHEMGVLREALQRFYADTGYLPKQGPFDLASRSMQGKVPDPSAALGGVEWFDSPANLLQLFEPPLDGSLQQIAPWNPDRRRGWHGPYLTRTDKGVVVGNALPTDGKTGTLISLNSPSDLPLEVPGLPDRFALPELDGSLHFLRWKDLSDAVVVRGRPYLLFDLGDPSRARIVSCGLDGDYTPLSAPRVNLADPPVDQDVALVHPDSDDIGMRILR